VKVLLVGAGAVGVSYGWYLQRGGADVTFMVRPKYAKALRGGTHVYFPRWRNEREPIAFEGFGVITSDAEVQAERWDQVWLCMSSTALKQPWLDGFLAAIGDTTLVMLQPGADDFDYLAVRYPSERIVTGLITLVAYQTPLPGEAPHPDGIAIYLPPLTPFPVRGEQSRARAVADAITRGGWKAKVQGPLEAKSGEPAGALLQAHVVALEAVGWSFDRLFRSPFAVLAADAGREGFAVTCVEKGAAVPAAVKLVRPATMNVFLRVARWVMPFDFEVYLEYHFMKVRDQTEAGLSDTIAKASARGMPHAAMSALRDAVFTARRA